MDVDVILTATKAAAFLPGEIGEVDCRVVNAVDGPRVAVVAYAAKTLSADERNVLVALRDYLVQTLEKAHYKTTRKPEELNPHAP